MKLSVYVSNISLLGPSDLARGLLTGRWPRVEDLISRSRLIGASGLQLTMLRGWDPVVVANRIAWEAIEIPNVVCAIEGPWHGTGQDPGLIGGRLFGHTSYRGTTTLIDLLEKNGVKPIVVDMDWYPDSCVEVADLPDRMDEVASTFEENGRGLVYDTWHAREVLPDSCREDWMRSPLVDLWSDPDWNKMYFADQAFRVSTNALISKQFWKVSPKVKMFQVQTRSKTELERFLAGYATMLGYQLVLVREHLIENKGTSVPVVVEGMPYWSNETQRRFVSKVWERLGR